MSEGRKLDCTIQPSTVTGRANLLVWVRAEFGGEGNCGAALPQEVGALDAPEWCAAGSVEEWGSAAVRASVHVTVFKRCWG